MISRLGLLFSVAALVSLSAPACTADPTANGDEDVGQVALALNSGFRLPFKCAASMTVTQGNNSGFSHTGASAYGFDFGVPLNTQLVASKAGKVSFARGDVKPGNPCYSGGGPSCVSTLNYVTIDHGDGTSTLYAHMNSVSVTVGQTVAQGQPIGLSGGTGWSTGPHTHLQRQTNCGAFTCQSVAMSFDDVGGSGVPVAGQTVKSQNACAGVDCALGNGYYCGGNGVKGDKATLFLCTGGTPAVSEKCTYGCLPMPPGTEDRCATAAEAPDAGVDAASEAAEAGGPASGEPPAPASGAPGSSGSSGDRATDGASSLPASDDPNASSCAMTPSTSSAGSRAWVGIVIAFASAVAALRRRRADGWLIARR